MFFHGINEGLLVILQNKLKKEKKIASNMVKPVREMGQIDPYNKAADQALRLLPQSLPSSLDATDQCTGLLATNVSKNFREMPLTAKSKMGCEIRK